MDSAGKRIGVEGYPVLLHFNFVGDDFPAASFRAIPIGVTLNSHTAKDSHDLSFCELVQTPNLGAFEG